MRLNGKTAIVTGGASGFGAGIVRKFAGEGARVMIADLNLEDVEAMVKATQDAFGGLDVLVNNAGTTHERGNLEDISEEAFDTVFDVNCKSVYLTARACVPHFKAQGSGCILNVSSTAGLSPRALLNWYNATKGWMNTATKTMAVELAPAGIRVNAINPVAGETPLLSNRGYGQCRVFSVL